MAPMISFLLCLVAMSRAFPAQTISKLHGALPTAWHGRTTPFIGTTAVAAATSSTLVAVEDNRSIGVINDRIKEMLQHLEEKTQSDLNHDELLRACHALILAITTKPEFQNHKLLHVEQAIFQQQGEGSNQKISRPTTADLEELLPWLELAYFAHEYNDAGSKSQLEAAIQESTGKE